MSQPQALGAAMVKEWKTAETGFQYLFRLFGDAMKAAALAWIMSQSGNSSYLAYLCVGAPLIAMWHGVIAIGGWSLNKELNAMTLDFIFISRTSLSITVFGQTLGQTLREIPSGIVALVTVLLVARTLPDFNHGVPLLLSVLLALVGLALTGFLFAALVVLAEGKAGFFMGMIPFGAVFSGLILPADQLPAGLDIIARCFPTSWAMDSVWQCIAGSASVGSIVAGWLNFVLVGGAWFLVTCWYHGAGCG